MKIKFHIISLFYATVTTAVHCQTEGFNYQILLESKLEYNQLYSQSEVNLNNNMGIHDFSSTTQVYPIFRFTHNTEKLQSFIQMEACAKNYNFDKDSLDFAFEELYIQFSSKDKHYFTAGKKRLDWGSGMIWNPTNFFIQKDPLRTQNRLEGIYQFNYTFLTKEHAFDIYIFPEKNIRNFSYAIKYGYTQNRIDACLSFLQYKNRQQIGYDISYGGDLFTAYSEGVIRNYTKSYTLLPAGTLVEPEKRKKKFRSELVLGTSLVINPKLSIRGEYRFREDYLSRKEAGIYRQFLPGNGQLFDPISLGKHSLYASLDHTDLYDRWSISLRSFYDPASGQLIVSPLGVWKKDSFQAELSVMAFNHSFAIYNFQSSLLLSYYF